MQVKQFETQFTDNICVSLVTTTTLTLNLSFFFILNTNEVLKTILIFFKSYKVRVNNFIKKILV